MLSIKNLNLKGGQMITKKSSYLILLLLLLFPIVIFAADYPIIFVHGIEGDPRPTIAWGTWNDPNSAMKKIINEGYDGYRWGKKSDGNDADQCDKNTTLQGMGGDRKRIYHFSYYNPDGSCGVIGTNSKYILYDHGFDPMVDEINYRFEYISQSMDANWSEHLADFIEDVCDATGSPKVNLVTHSMGGVVSRAAIAFYGCASRVNKLLTIGTPNNKFEENQPLANLIAGLTWIEWQGYGELREMGLLEPYLFVGPGDPDDPANVDDYYGWMLKNSPPVTTACIAGKKPTTLTQFFEENDGVIQVEKAHLDYEEFGPTIYATHARSNTSWDEEAEITSTYTNEIIKRWIIDDDEMDMDAQVDGSFQVLYDNTNWPNNNDRYCGSIRIKIPVTDYQDVLNVVAKIKVNTYAAWAQARAKGNELEAEGATISVKSIPLYEGTKSGTGEYVSILLEPGKLINTYFEGNDWKLACTIYLYVNDIENGEVEREKLTFFIDKPSNFQEYNGEKITGSFVDVTEPVAGSKIPGNTLEIKWVSNENVLSRKVYFSTDGGNTYTEIGSLGSRGNGTTWVRGDFFLGWRLPAVASDQCKIKVVESIDDITFISDESETFTAPGDVVLEDIAVMYYENRTYRAYNTITASDFTIQAAVKGGANVTMGAGETVYLKTGFQAQEGCYFHAFADPSIRWNPSTSLETESMSLIPKPKKDSTKTTKPSVELSSKEIKEKIPKVFSCAQNSPNPFGDNTTIKYGLPKNSHVKLTIFNLAGQAVRTLADKNEPAGFKQVRWDGKSSSGKQVPQGIYFYVFKAGDYTKHRKMVMVK